CSPAATIDRVIATVQKVALNETLTQRTVLCSEHEGSVAQRSGVGVVDIESVATQKDLTPAHRLDRVRMVVALLDQVVDIRVDDRDLATGDSRALGHVMDVHPPERVVVEGDRWPASAL